MQVFLGIVLLMTVVGLVVPLAMAHAWGPRWVLLFSAWAGCVLLSVRGILGVGDALVRYTGLLPKGFSGLTTAQVMGTEHPSTWALTASSATDFLFALGGLAFGLAALTYQRATVNHTVDQSS